MPRGVAGRLEGKAPQVTAVMDARVPSDAPVDALQEVDAPLRPRRAIVDGAPYYKDVEACAMGAGQRRITTKMDTYPFASECDEPAFAVEEMCDIARDLQRIPEFASVPIFLELRAMWKERRFREEAAFSDKLSQEGMNHHAVLSLDGKLIIFGGPHYSIERYCVTANQDHLHVRIFGRAGQHKPGGHHM